MSSMKRILLCVCLLIFGGCTTQENKNSISEDASVKEKVEDTTVSFLAVGDNLIHNAVYDDPYQYHDGRYDYQGMYEHIKPYLEGVDVKNINQETPLGGRALGLSNYPQFNGPTEIGDAIVQVGFNWISQASNHAIDAGEQAIQNQMEIWDQYSSVISTGMNRTQEEADTMRIFKVNGITIGLLNYTYGLNGLSLPDGKEYLVNLIDEESIRQDVEELKKHSDVIIASMHWGTEYQFIPNEEQKALAQMMSDAGVSVIIGAHPHVIQPMEYITSKDNQKTLVMYSLGNFISAQNIKEAMLGGMATWNIVKDGETGAIRIEEATFYPTITQFDAGMQNFDVYALKDYTDDLAAQHYLAGQVSRQYFIDTVEEVIGHPENIDVKY